MLYIIATPIGNLGDITVRALKTLEKIDILLCEDTRKTGLMLNSLKKIDSGFHRNDKLKLVSFYDEVEEQKIPEVISWLRQEKEVGLVTNGGTPAVSDPGWRLIKRCHELGLPLTSIPGPCAAINALVLSGLPCGRFSFLGFLLKKKGKRKKILEKYKEVEGAKVVYESPFRVERLVKEIKEVYGENVEIRICREMTKKFEEVVGGKELKKLKGEISVVFS